MGNLQFNNDLLLFTGGEVLAFGPDCCCTALGECFLITATKAGSPADPADAEPAASFKPPFPTDGSDARYLWHGDALDNNDTPAGTNYHNHGWIVQACIDGATAISDYLAELATWESANEGGANWADDITIEHVGNCADGVHGDYDALIDYARSQIQTPVDPSPADTTNDYIGPLAPEGFC